MHLLIVKVIVAVDNGEHFLVELIEKFVHHVGEVELAAQEVAFKLHKQLAKDVGILLVDDAIRLLKHLMKTIS